MADLTFLGTGNFFSPPGRYWNSFVIDGSILVEPSPIALPHLRRCGIDLAALDAVVLSHFHADHTFGWPFLLVASLVAGRSTPLHVVGPPGVQAYLDEMCRIGSLVGAHRQAHAQLDLHYVEVDGTWQDAGPVRLRAVPVEHVPYLQCYGYLFDRGAKTVGYSGDTHPCPGLDELASAADVLVLECNGGHPEPSHMDTGRVRELRQRAPHVPFVLTHMGADVDASGLDGVTVPQDFETLTI